MVINTLLNLKGHYISKHGEMPDTVLITPTNRVGVID